MGVKNQYQRPLLECLVSVLAIVFLLAPQSYGHGDNEHENPQSNTDDIESLDVYRQINDKYLKVVKPIFQKKCLDCHGTGNEKPWYYVLPGSKQLMDHDIEEAKEHLDMSDDFPFGGHGAPKEDLEELNEVIEENSMPPWQYKIMHWSSALTNSEKKVVKDWINESLEKFNRKP